MYTDCRVTNLGGEAVTDEERETVMKSRQEAQAIYRVWPRPRVYYSCRYLHVATLYVLLLHVYPLPSQRRSHIAAFSKEDKHAGTTCIRRRTRRRARENPSRIPTFDPYNNDAWGRRYTSLQRFVQAARRVVMEIRRRERLGGLRKLTSSVREGKSLEAALGEDVMCVHKLMNYSLCTCVHHAMQYSNLYTHKC